MVQSVFASLVIIAGAHLFVTEVEFFSTNRMRPVPFLLAGHLYAVFVTVVVYHVVVPGVGAAGR